jgi:hypothetical protein
LFAINCFVEFGGTVFPNGVGVDRTEDVGDLGCKVGRYFFEPFAMPYVLFVQHNDYNNPN